MMTKFTYLGPDTSVTINNSGQRLNVQLRHGRTVELPADAKYTRTLVAKGLLVQLDETNAKSESKSKVREPSPAPEKGAETTKGN